MKIFDEDIVSGVDPLPVRNGCYGGPCACTGYCKEVIGHIDRTKYMNFLASYVSPEDFVKANYVEAPPATPDTHAVKYISVDYGNSRPMDSIMALQAMKFIGDIRPLEFYKRLFDTTTITDQDLIDFVLAHREKFTEYVGRFEGKLTIREKY